MKQIELFEAKTEHLDWAAVLFDAYRQFYQFPSDLEAGRRFLQERLSRKESRVFLATVDGEPTGFMQLYPSFSSLSLKPVWILYDLFVAPAGRKLGIATQLLEKAHKLALETGASEVNLATAQNNIPAQRAYEQMGWNRDEEFYYYNLVV